ncbi:MAG: hypothetical protein ACP5J4_05825 [Anaerolineae bacterium]
MTRFLLPRWMMIVIAGLTACTGAVTPTPSPTATPAPTAAVPLTADVFVVAPDGDEEDGQMSIYT